MKRTQFNFSKRECDTSSTLYLLLVTCLSYRVPNWRGAAKIIKKLPRLRRTPIRPRQTLPVGCDELNIFWLWLLSVWTYERFRRTTRGSCPRFTHMKPTPWLTPRYARLPRRLWRRSGNFPPGSCRLSSRSCVQVLVIYPIHKRKNTYTEQCTGNWLHVTRPLYTRRFYHRHNANAVHNIIPYFFPADIFQPYIILFFFFLFYQYFYRVSSTIQARVRFWPHSRKKKTKLKRHTRRR